MVACVIGVFFLSVNRPLFSAGGPVKTTDLWPLFSGLGWTFHPGPNIQRNHQDNLYRYPEVPCQIWDRKRIRGIVYNYIQEERKTGVTDYCMRYHGSISTRAGQDRPDDR